MMVNYLFLGTSNMEVDTGHPASLPNPFILFYCVVLYCIGVASVVAEPLRLPLSYDRGEPAVGYR